MVVAVAHACEPGIAPGTPQCTVTRPIGGKVVCFRAQKMKKQAPWRETMASPGSPLSPLFSLFLFLSFSLSPSLYLSPLSLSLSLSLPFSLSLSVSQSLSLKGHTHTHRKNCRVNAHPYGGPTDFASNCIHLGG